MTCEHPNRVIQRRAATLLSAWNGGHLALEAALRRDSAAKMSVKKKDSADAERDEMVDAAEIVIRTWLQNPTPETELDLQISLRLLSHLAGSELAIASA
jgi:hypothetical protein